MNQVHNLRQSIIFVVIAFVALFFCPRLGDAQVTFCPKGAIWNYSFVYIPAWNGVYNHINESVKYDRDSLIDGASVKVLSHRFYYSDCYNIGLNHRKITCIKQVGDTVFFRNSRTQHKWEILYNYAISAQGNWNTIILKANNSAITYTTTVDSVKQIVQNSNSLKRLFKAGGYITERYGDSKFLFNFPGYAGCDGYFIADFLCYSDSAFGQVTFTERACDFSGSIDISAIEELDKGALMVFPNPVDDVLNIFFESEGIIGATYIVNALGQKLHIDSRTSSHNQINVDFLSPGIYFLEVEVDSKLIRKKIVKN